MKDGKKEMKKKEWHKINKTEKDFLNEQKSIKCKKVDT